jgi:hypothetical protein
LDGKKTTQLIQLFRIPNYETPNSIKTIFSYEMSNGVSFPVLRRKERDARRFLEQTQAAPASARRVLSVYTKTPWKFIFTENND